MNLLRSFFKKDPEKRNIYHVDYRDKVELAFKIDNVSYYRFKETSKTPHLRMFYMNFYIDQYRNGMEFEPLESYLEKIQDQVERGKIGDASYTIKALRERIKINQELGLLYKIATVVYFTDDEDLENFYPSENADKLKTFRKSKEHAFFLTSPMINIFPLLNSFVSDSGAFLNKVRAAEEIINEIDSLFLHPSDNGL
jgi:hypothetical protein